MEDFAYWSLIQLNPLSNSSNSHLRFYFSPAKNPTFPFLILALVKSPLHKYLFQLHAKS